MGVKTEMKSEPPTSSPSFTFHASFDRSCRERMESSLYGDIYMVERGADGSVSLSTDGYGR